MIFHIDNQSIVLKYLQKLSFLIHSLIAITACMFLQSLQNGHMTNGLIVR